MGATDWFVRTPFLIEGVIQGLLSGAVAVAALYAGYVLVAAKKMPLLAFAMLEFVFIPQAYCLSILLLSGVLALLGSLLAVGQFFEL